MDIGVLFLSLLDHFQTRMTRHVEVGDNQVETFPLHSFHRFIAILNFQDREAHLFRAPHEQLAELRVVIGNEHTP